MLFTGSTGVDDAGVAGTSSSARPFLNDLMPFATSPISSDTLPRPNKSMTMMPTITQCQMLMLPMAQSSHGVRLGCDVTSAVTLTTRTRFWNLCVPCGKNKDFGLVDVDTHLL